MGPGEGIIVYRDASMFFILGEEEEEEKKGSHKWKYVKFLFKDVPVN